MLALDNCKLWQRGCKIHTYFQFWKKKNYQMNVSKIGFWSHIWKYVDPYTKNNNACKSLSSEGWNLKEHPTHDEYIVFSSSKKSRFNWSMMVISYMKMLIISPGFWRLCSSSMFTPQTLPLICAINDKLASMLCCQINLHGNYYSMKIWNNAHSSFSLKSNRQAPDSGQ